MIKSKERINDYGEVFTSEKEVKAMLDLVKDETLRIDSRFLEPACGDGNFLIEVLRRKLEVVVKSSPRSQIDFERESFKAIASLYGIDILEDNVVLCRARMHELFENQYTMLYGIFSNKMFLESIRYVLKKNIIYGNALTLSEARNNKPIVFSEWCFESENKVKQKEYTLGSLLAYQSLNIKVVKADSIDDDSFPNPLKSYPCKHFKEIGDGRF